jgi:hypothetical protein
MSDKKLAKKILSKQEYQDSKFDDNRKVVKGSKESIDTKQIKKHTPIKEFEERIGLHSVKRNAKKLIKEGKGEEAKSLLKKAMKSKAFQKIAKAAGKKALKAIPIVGGVASAVMSGDASAAVPILSEAEDIGAPKGSDLRRSEDPSLSAEERHKLQEKIRQSIKAKKAKK